MVTEEGSSKYEEQEGEKSLSLSLSFFLSISPAFFLPDKGSHTRGEVVK